MRSADRVVLVTDRMAHAFRRQYAGPAGRALRRRCPNGFDRGQFDSTADAPQPDERLRRPARGRAVLRPQPGRAFSTPPAPGRNAIPSFARTFRLTLARHARRRRTSRTARQRPRRDASSSSGQLDHAIGHRGDARRPTLLLLVANTTPGAEATVPGKLFEYLAVGRPVLAIAPPDSSTADVLAPDRRRLARRRRRSGRHRLRRCSALQAPSGRHATPSESAPRSPASTAASLAGDLARIFDEARARCSRVGFDGRDLLRKRTGVVNNTLHLARELTAAHPSEVIVYADRPAAAGRGSRPPDVPLRRLRRAADPVEAPGPATGAARATGCDVFHSPTGTLPLLAPCRQVVTIHDLFAAVEPAGSRRAWAGSCARRSAAPRTRPARVIAVSECTRRDLVERYGVPARTHPRRLQRRRPRPLPADRSRRRSGRAALRRAATRSSCASAR